MYLVDLTLTASQLTLLGELLKSGDRSKARYESSFWGCTSYL